MKPELLESIYETMAGEVYQKTGCKMKKVPTKPTYYNIIHQNKQFGVGFNQSGIYIYNSYNPEKRHRFQSYSAWKLTYHIVQENELRNPDTGNIVKFLFPEDMELSVENISQRLKTVIDDLLDLKAFDWVQ